MDEGYTIDHVVPSGKLITLLVLQTTHNFRQPEDRYKNKGAYIVLKPPCFDDPEFHSFEAITPRPAVNAYYDYKDVIDSDEELDLASNGDLNLKVFTPQWWPLTQCFCFFSM
nr:serine/threonine-protein phosphatase 7-like [Populus alba]